MTEGRRVYLQEHDTKYGASECKLFSLGGVWRITWRGYEGLRAATPSESPTTKVKWQYDEYDKNTWRDDPKLTVTGLTKKPSCECEVTISLSQDIVTDIKDPGVAGVYKPDGSYYMGKPVLQHSGGLFVFVSGCWMVESGVGGAQCLLSGSAPSQCPADPKAVRNERRRQKLWGYENKQGKWPESRGIKVKCIKCVK